MFLMDRFGYAKTIDMSVYDRNKEAADSENKYVFSCMNTGKICIFTDTGKQHTVKVQDLPFGKFRDKSVPIDNFGNFSSTEEQIVGIGSMEVLKHQKLLFGTRQGMLKIVDGSEFETKMKTMAATKLNEGDELLKAIVTDGNRAGGAAEPGRIFPALRYLRDTGEEKGRGRSPGDASRRKGRAGSHSSVPYRAGRKRRI